MVNFNTLIRLNTDVVQHPNRKKMPSNAQLHKHKKT